MTITDKILPSMILNKTNNKKHANKHPNDKKRIYILIAIQNLLIVAKPGTFRQIIITQI